MADLSSFTCMNATAFDLAGLTGTFQALNGSGFSDDIKVLKVYNGGTSDIDISYNGVDKHDFWPQGAALIIDLQANHADNSAYGSGQLNGRKGQIVYGRTSTTSGQLQISGYR